MKSKYLNSLLSRTDSSNKEKEYLNSQDLTNLKNIKNGQDEEEKLNPEEDSLLHRQFETSLLLDTYPLYSQRGLFFNIQSYPRFESSQSMRLSHQPSQKYSLDLMNPQKRQAPPLELKYDLKQSKIMNDSEEDYLPKTNSSQIEYFNHEKLKSELIGSLEDEGIQEEQEKRTENFRAEDQN